MAHGKEKSMRVLFEYPSEFESAKVLEEFRKQRQIKIALEKKVYIFMIAAASLLIVSLATKGVLSTVFFVGFVISTLIAYALRKAPKGHSNYVFVTAYDECIHIVAYDSDLIGRTDAIIYYQDVIKYKFKNNTLEVLIYETLNSSVIWYNSDGAATSLVHFKCKVAPGSEFEEFLTNLAPTLFP